jgi:hypothetical protein
MLPISFSFPLENPGISSIRTASSGKFGNRFKLMSSDLGLHRFPCFQRRSGTISGSIKRALSIWRRVSEEPELYERKDEDSISNSLLASSISKTLSISE